MVFFLHMILMDSDERRRHDAWGGPRSSARRGAEPLSQAPLELVVRE